MDGPIFLYQQQARGDLLNQPVPSSLTVFQPPLSPTQSPISQPWLDQNNWFLVPPAPPGLAFWFLYAEPFAPAHLAAPAGAYHQNTTDLQPPPPSAASPIFPQQLEFYQRLPAPLTWEHPAAEILFIPEPFTLDDFSFYQDTVVPDLPLPLPPIDPPDFNSTPLPYMSFIEGLLLMTHQPIFGRFFNLQPIQRPTIPVLLPPPFGPPGNAILPGEPAPAPPPPDPGPPSPPGDVFGSEDAFFQPPIVLQ